MPGIDDVLAPTFYGGSSKQTPIVTPQDTKGAEELYGRDSRNGSDVMDDTTDASGRRVITIGKNQSLLGAMNADGLSDSQQRGAYGELVRYRQLRAADFDSRMSPVVQDGDQFYVDLNDVNHGDERLGGRLIATESGTRATLAAAARREYWDAIQEGAWSNRTNEVAGTGSEPALGAGNQSPGNSSARLRQLRDMAGEDDSSRHSAATWAAATTEYRQLKTLQDGVFQKDTFYFGLSARTQQAQVVEGIGLNRGNFNDMAMAAVDGNVHADVGVGLGKALGSSLNGGIGMAMGVAGRPTDMPVDVGARRVGVEGAGDVPGAGMHIPSGPDGAPIPLAQRAVPGVGDVPLPLGEAGGAPHTVLGGKLASDGQTVYRQTATFPGGTWPALDGIDVPWGRVDWTSHSYLPGPPHPNPHIHEFSYEPVQKQWQIGPPKPFGGH